jgi:hypothetical protein
MTKPKSDAQRKFDSCIKYVQAEWGPGWNRLGVTLQMALIRAEVLAEIYRAPCDSGSALYHELTALAVEWWPAE